MIERSEGVSQMLAQIRAMAAAAGGKQISVSTMPPKADFGLLLSNAISAVSEAQKNSAALTADFEMGKKNISIAEVMIASQKANLGFQAMTQVRNKLVSAYQEIMNMSV